MGFSSEGLFGYCWSQSLFQLPLLLSELKHSQKQQRGAPWLSAHCGEFR